MEKVLLKAFAFILIIILAYALKRIGFFKPKDHELVAKITLNLTLPAAIIVSFGSFKPEPMLFFLFLLGLMGNLLMYGIGFFLSRNKNDAYKALYTLTVPGYNIGAFTLPFVQNFFGASSVVMLCIFDSGNAIMCTGGSYALTSGFLNRDVNGGVNVKEILKKLFSSVPFDTYMLLFILAFFGITVSDSIVQIAEPIGAANGFMAMLMIGMMFEIKMKPAYIKSAVLILGVRYGCAALLAAMCYFMLPFSLEIRQMLVIALFSPVTALAPIFTERCGGDAGLSSFTGSVSIMISIVLMTVLIGLMQVN